MKSVLKDIGLPAVASFLLIVPLIIMEVVNRRRFEEEFPFVLFFGMWQLLFAISLILLPIVRGKLAASRMAPVTVSGPGNTLFPNARTATILSMGLFLTTIVWGLLSALGWEPLLTLINGPNPEQQYLPGLFISLGLFWLSVMAGVLAGVPIARTLRSGGRLLSHPVNWIIVGVLLSFFAFGFVSLLIDQWPCFIGVPLCD